MDVSGTQTTIIGKHVLSDFELDSLQIPSQTSWGSAEFQRTLQSPTADTSILKNRQLALFALRHKMAANTADDLRKHIRETAEPATEIVDELETEMDPRIIETIEQIYWSPSSFGAFLNDKQHIIAPIVFWKTLVLPTLAVAIPLLAIIIPFFLIRFFHGIELSPEAYMGQLRTIMLKQITIPPILKAKHDGDVIGYMLETGFMVLTAITYCSGIWTQVQSSLHLRAIALGLKSKGEAMAKLMGGFETMLEMLVRLPDRLRRALRPFILRGEKILADIAPIPRDCGYRTYGYLWNHRTALGGLKTWIGELDAMLGIVAIPAITFPRYGTEGTPLSIEGVYHPALTETGISNTVDWSPVSHAILTGPNRGGKSTLCRAVGISILCAQSWGFAFARNMRLCPFEWIETALHPADTVGKMSLFEAEIEFAKDVLRQGGNKRPVFVMMDEIFHSTNAIDGLAASRVFLSQLFRNSNITSLISTHYKELPAEYSKEALAWAMEAHETDTGLLEYTYKMTAGISDKSSVMEILRERGLIAD